MKKQMKLNHQLLLTLVVLLGGSIIAFGIILPISIRFFVDRKTYETLLVEQDKLMELGKYYDIQYGRQNGVYHLVYSKNGTMSFNEIDSEVLHQRLMYNEFFDKLKSQIDKQEKMQETYKFQASQESIYYVIQKSEFGEGLVSYTIEANNQSLSHQLFMDTLFIIVVALTIILIIFFRWNNRFVKNLKEIQERLDLIGEGKITQPVELKEDVLEFQEVMIALEDMRKKLYENEQVKKKMIHNISHDLKTPIAVIKSYAESIMDGVYPYGTVEQTAQVIFDQASHLQKRVQGLLYLNRLEYIRSQDEVDDVFDMEELIREVASYMEPLENKPQIELYLTKQMYEGDIEKWRVVLENLIDNARRYARDKIVITLNQNQFQLFNDGEAIEEVQYGSIFEPFEVGKGGVTGLGLAIVKKTLMVYGYSITYKNEDEGGVTFTICKKE